jgi:hypothetical protein
VNEFWLSCTLRPFSSVPSAFSDVQQTDATMREPLEPYCYWVKATFVASYSQFPMPSRAVKWSSKRVRSIQRYEFLARTHSEPELQHLKKHGATKVIMGEHEIAKAMLADIAPQG